MTNTLIDMQIGLIDNNKKAKEFNQHNIIIISNLTNDKKSIESLLKEKDENNKLLISGPYKVRYKNELVSIISEIKKLKDLKKDKEQIIISNKQCITFQKDLIKTTRKGSGKDYDSLTLLMEKILVTFGIDKARYHGGALEGNSIQKLFQNAHEIFNTFLKEIMTIITDVEIISMLKDQVKRYIEICTLFDSLFSLSRTPCGEMNDIKLNNLYEIITICMKKWNNLRLSMKMIKIHGVEDHLFEQIKKYNGI